MSDPPGKRGGWHFQRGQGGAFWLIILVLQITGTGAVLPTPLYVLYQQRFHFSEIMLTLIYAVYICGSIIGLLFFGRLSDQIGRRPVMLAVLSVAAVSTVIFLFIENVAMLFLARVLSGWAVAVSLGTATAFLAELEPHQDKRRATVFTSITNMLGLGGGPLLCGLLTQYGPMPMRLPFLVYLALLVPAGLGIRAAPETVGRKVDHASFRPRIGVPREIRQSFISPAVAVFCMFALAGLFSALAPSMLQHQLNERNHAVAGGIVFGLYGAAAIAEAVFQKLKSRRAMLTGLLVLLVALALVVLALKMKSLAILLVGTVVGGSAMGLIFQGSLKVVNRIAPGDRRSEVVSSFFLVGYIGLALPAIGVGVLTDLKSAYLANLTFATAIAALTVTAFVAGLRYPPKDSGG